MKRLSLLSTLVAFAVVAVADGGDDTLRYYIEKAELVAVASIVSVATLGIKEEGVQPYSCKVKVVEVLRGAPALAKAEQELTVYIERFENKPEDQLSILKPGSKCIFFLVPSGRSDTDHFNSVDMWFGIQPYNSHMASRIKELSQPKKK